MSINTNNWNIRRYSFYAPFYDWIARVFDRYRSGAISNLDIKANEHVLIIGAGTGLDFQFLPPNAQIIATDITPAMVHRCRLRADKLDLPVSCLQMDGQKLEFQDHSFDKVILHLILAVIPDPKACIHEVDRILKPGGQISVFDKFVADTNTISWFRKVLNPLTNFFFSNINRSLQDIITGTDLYVMKQEDPVLFGTFTTFLMGKR
jgi:ubiquinone/menaquinone biosynthesis C-methylase UbiE